MSAARKLDAIMTGMGHAGLTCGTDPGAACRLIRTTTPRSTSCKMPSGASWFPADVTWPVTASVPAEVSISRRQIVARPEKSSRPRPARSEDRDRFRHVEFDSQHTPAQSVHLKTHVAPPELQVLFPLANSKVSSPVQVPQRSWMRHMATAPGRRSVYRATLSRVDATSHHVAMGASVNCARQLCKSRVQS